MTRHSRRTMLRTLAALGIGAPLLRGLPWDRVSRAQAQELPNLVIVRTLFGLRVPSRADFDADLAPLAPWRTRTAVVGGMSANGDGSEYHNGKQIRFATSCAPQNRNNRNFGGGRFDGKSVDVVAGEHLALGADVRHPYLLLGASAYVDSELHTTFETMSFTSPNQYVRPQYDTSSIRTQIGEHAEACGGPVQTRSPERRAAERVALEHVLRDFSRSRQGQSSEVIAQTEDLERQLVGLRDDLDRESTATPMCAPLRAAPLAHAHTPHPVIPTWCPERVRNMNFTAALALKTNFTRVVTLNYSFSGHHQPEVPPFHFWTHPVPRSPGAEEFDRLDGLSDFQVHMFAHLLEELDDFGLLDRTLVVFAIHERSVHNHTDVPLVAVGAPRTGVYRVGRRDQDVARDILQHLRVPGAAEFGGETSRGGVIT